MNLKEQQEEILNEVKDLQQQLMNIDDNFNINDICKNCRSIEIDCICSAKIYAILQWIHKVFKIPVKVEE